MAHNIVTIDLNKFASITTRDVNIPSKFITSLDYNCTNGNFVISEPLDGQITKYPLNPSTTDISYPIKSIKYIGNVGNLIAPIDAKYDFTRRLLWIADIGNKIVASIDAENYTFNTKTENISIPHAICPNFNIGGAIYKAYKDIATGVIGIIDSTGNNIFTFEFPSTFPYSTLDYVATWTWIESLPSSSTLFFDYARDKIWWIDGLYSYMINMESKTVNRFYWGDYGYKKLNSIQVDIESGNAFIAVSQYWGKSYIAQINEYNTDVLGASMFFDYDLATRPRSPPQ